MFGLFGKRKMDVGAATAFWKWFVEHEEWIISNIRTNGSAVVWAIDEQLKPIFPYFKKELEFQLGFNDGKGEFFFFHFGDKVLQKDAESLKEMMPTALTERWTFIAEK
jgi:hypothetical protein